MSCSASSYDDSYNNNNTIEKTKILYGCDKVINAALQFVSNTQNKIDACVDHTRPSLIVAIEQVKNAFLDAKKRGVKLRYITEITSENVSFCRKLLIVVDELRHLDGIKGNLYVSETEYLAPSAFHEKGKPASQIVYSSIKEIVKEQQYMFDTLWSKAALAEDRIREIEQGIEPEYFRVISDYDEASNILIELAKSAKKEILLLIPNDKAMVRIDRLGVIDCLIDKSHENNKEEDIQIKVICPISDVNSDIINRILQKASNNIRIVNGNNTSSGIIIVDNTKFLKAELREPTAEEFSKAIGLSFYSNSKASVDSYRLFFELLWNERTTNEKLKLHDRMQTDFINIASHELRTPTQTILGCAELLEIEPEKSTDYIKPISRNAKRLQRLTDDILDVARIDCQKLVLNKETFDLGITIKNAIEDFRNEIDAKTKKKISLLYHHKEEEEERDNDCSILLQADKSRIIQVISNLLSNSIKFTAEEGEGVIEVTTERKDNDNNTNSQVIVSIRDSGKGINPEIFPKLFAKFVTDCDSKGTGLGLFISKSIIEAHDGRIWAENNPDGKGATFAFSIPVS
jgi:two-component system sensor histidine kinase VicK